MRKRQPDNRIRPENLGMMDLRGKRFVINLGRGVPFNACIEDFKGSLRCWASHNWLTDEAATVIDKYAIKTDAGAFVWDSDVRQGPFACIKGDHTLYSVIFP